jgi:hypothetical protein
LGEIMSRGQLLAAAAVGIWRKAGWLLGPGGDGGESTGAWESTYEGCWDVGSGKKSGLKAMENCFLVMKRG